MGTSTEEEGNNFTVAGEGMQASSRSASSKSTIASTNSQASPKDKKLTVDQMVSAAMKHANELKQKHDAIQSSLEHDSEDTPKNLAPPVLKQQAVEGTPLVSRHSNGTVAAPSSGELSSESTESGRTSSPTNWDDVIIDEKMGMEASAVAQSMGDRSTVGTSLRSIPDSELDESELDRSDGTISRERWSGGMPQTFSRRAPTAIAADGGFRNGSLNSGDLIVDEMVREALNYAREAKESDKENSVTT